MSKFLGFLKEITPNKFSVGMVHNMPFDEKHGLGKTKEQLETEGALVDGIPEEQNLEGFSSTLYYDPQIGQAYYEYTKIENAPDEA